MAEKAANRAQQSQSLAAALVAEANQKAAEVEAAASAAPAKGSKGPAQPKVTCFSMLQHMQDIVDKHASSHGKASAHANHRKARSWHCPADLSQDNVICPEHHLLSRGQG